MGKKSVSTLQLLAHLMSVTPIIVLTVDYFLGKLTVNPIQAATQHTGDAAIVLLLLSLSITPFITLTGAHRLKGLRRTLGLYAFAYATVHVILFIGLDYGFQWAFLKSEFSQKPYLWVGLPAFLILIALAVTSSQRAIKWLGKTWKHLHRLVYLAGTLALAHLALVIKGDLINLSGDIWKPTLMAATLTIVFVLRIPQVKRWVIVNRQKLISLLDSVASRIFRQNSI